MRSLPGRLAVLLLVALTLACGAHSAGGPRADRNVITQQQMLEGRFANLYDAVKSLRPNWLQPRGADGMHVPSEVWVYFDEARLGGVETLRQLEPTAVASARFVDGASAQGRWGMDHNAGAIAVTSLNRRPGAGAQSP